MSGCEEDQKNIEVILTLFEFLFVTLINNNNAYTKLFEKLTKSYLKSNVT